MVQEVSVWLELADKNREDIAAGLLELSEMSEILEIEEMKQNMCEITNWQGNNATRQSTPSQDWRLLPAVQTSTSGL